MTESNFVTFALPRELAKVLMDHPATLSPLVEQEGTFPHKVAHAVALMRPQLEGHWYCSDTNEITTERCCAESMPYAEALAGGWVDPEGVAHG